MPKTLPERIFFTIVMAAIMVYGMIVYNVALNTNGVTNATFVMALHEMPIMVPVAFVLVSYLKFAAVCIASPVAWFGATIWLMIAYFIIINRIIKKANFAKINY